MLLQSVDTSFHRTVVGLLTIVTTHHSRASQLAAIWT